MVITLLVACFNTSVLAQETARTVKTRYRCATLFTIPASEVIEKLVIGDPYHFSCDRERHNIFHVVPLKSLQNSVAAKGKHPSPPKWDGKSNIHAICRSGKDYEFDLQQVDGGFDSAINVEADDPPKEERASSECDTGLKVQLTAASLREMEKQNKIDQLNLDLQGKMYPTEFIASVQDDYKIPRKLRRDPFRVSHIYSRGGYTYIRSKAWRQAAFYEKDGKEKRHVNYDPHGGVYVIPGEVSEGCLKIGKHEGCFKKKG